jgi:hypothetical protein
MQTDLHAFLLRLAGAVALALVPVLFIALLCLPTALHHAGGERPVDLHPAPAHMT